MNMVFIGEYIQKRRKSMGLTQETVCRGICDCATLSRIENGRVTPRKTVISALLQRLGLPEENYYAFLSKNELEIEALKKEITACIVTGQPKSGLQALHKMETLLDPEDTLNRQFLLRAQASLTKSECSPPQTLDLLQTALRLTCPQFDISCVGDFLYTVDELKTLNQIALLYSDMEERGSALKLFQQLLHYIQEHDQELLSSSSLLQLVLFNYARELGLAAQYKASIQAAEECQQLCIRYGHYQVLPGCLAIMAECAFYLGNTAQSADLYRQAYYMYKSIDRPSDMARTQKESFDHLGLQLDQAMSCSPSGISSAGIG